MLSGWCVWITGLPGSGKSVISNALLSLLKERSIRIELLSTDTLRRVMTPTPIYSTTERDSVYDTLVYVANLLTRNGTNVIIDATGNLRKYRENARRQIPRFLEVYLKCPLSICVKREAERQESYDAPKQIYERAIKGETRTVPGVGQPYEPPRSPDLTIDTTTEIPKESARKIANLIAGICSESVA